MWGIRPRRSRRQLGEIEHVIAVAIYRHRGDVEAMARGIIAESARGRFRDPPEPRLFLVRADACLAFKVPPELPPDGLAQGDIGGDGLRPMRSR